MSRKNPCDMRKRELCANSSGCGGTWWDTSACRGFVPSDVDACYKCGNYAEYNTRTPGEYVGRCFIPTDDDLVYFEQGASWDGGPCVLYDVAPEFAGRGTMNPTTRRTA